MTPLQKRIEAIADVQIVVLEANPHIRNRDCRRAMNLALGLSGACSPKDFCEARKYNAARGIGVVCERQGNRYGYALSVDSSDAYRDAEYSAAKKSITTSVETLNNKTSSWGAEYDTAEYKLVKPMTEAEHEADVARRLAIGLQAALTA